MIDRACSSPLVVLADADACHVSTCRFHLPADQDGHRCALLYAERGGMTLEEVGELMGVTRERIRQVEAEALKHKHVAAWARVTGVNAFAHASHPAP